MCKIKAIQGECMYEFIFIGWSSSESGSYEIVPSFILKVAIAKTHSHFRK